MSKSSGKQFLLNIKPKYRQNVSFILEEKKKNREASDWVCQAILEKFTREQLSLETKVEKMLQSDNQNSQSANNSIALQTIAQLLTSGNIPLQTTNPNDTNINGLVEEAPESRESSRQTLPQSPPNNIVRGENHNASKVIKRKNSLLNKLKRS